MDHRGAAPGAEHQRDVRGWAPAHLLGIAGIIGDEAAADLGTVRTAHDDGIAAGKLAVDPDDPHGQQAVAAPQGGDGAGVDGEGALGLQRAGDPFLA